MRGLGVVLCAGTTRAGYPCFAFEVEGFGYCLHHVPDEQLELAENRLGFCRCRIRFGQPDACRMFAVKGTELDPHCKVHGLNFGSVQRRNATIGVIMGEAAILQAEIMAGAYRRD